MTTCASAVGRCAKQCKLLALRDPRPGLEVRISGMHSVLVVDDDPHISEVVCYALRQAGYKTFAAANGEAALAQFSALKPDLVVLDILMPELDGLEVCRRIRRQASTPIIFLSSKDEEIDRVVGLELGADDYVVKPFSPRELVARVRTNLRRVASEAAPATRPAPLVVDKLVIDAQTLEARWDDQPLPLTHTEFSLLKTLASRPDKVFDRDTLMAGAYEVQRVVSYRTIDSHIRRLRDKLAQAGAPGIRTIHGVGYRLQRL